MVSLVRLCIKRYTVGIGYSDTCDRLNNVTISDTHYRAIHYVLGYILLPKQNRADIGTLKVNKKLSQALYSNQRNLHAYSGRSDASTVSDPNSPLQRGKIPLQPLVGCDSQVADSQSSYVAD